MKQATFRTDIHSYQEITCIVYISLYESLKSNGS